MKHRHAHAAAKTGLAHRIFHHGRVVGVRFGQKVRDVDHFAAADCPGRDRGPVGPHRKAAQQVPYAYRVDAERTRRVDPFSVEAKDESVLRAGEPSGALGDNIEDRLHVGGRFADDFEHLGGSRLGAPSASVVSLKRRTFSIAMTAWSAKVCTSAISAGVNGLTVLRATEITPMVSPSRNKGTFSTVRNPYRAWISRTSGYSVSISGTRSSTWIVRRSSAACTADGRSAHRKPFADGLGWICRPVARHRTQLVAVHEPHAAHLRMAEQAGSLGHRVENRQDVGRRLADHLEDLGCRRLPLQRFLRLVEQLRVAQRETHRGRYGTQQMHFGLAIGILAFEALERDRGGQPIADEYWHEDGAEAPIRSGASSLRPSRIRRGPVLQDHGLAGQ